MDSGHLCGGTLGPRGDESEPMLLGSEQCTQNGAESAVQIVVNEQSAVDNGTGAQEGAQPTSWTAQSLPTQGEGQTISLSSNSLTVPTTANRLLTKDLGSPDDDFLGDAECLSTGSGEETLADVLVKGTNDPDDNLPKRTSSHSRRVDRLRTGSKLSAYSGGGDAASSYGSRVSFQPTRTRQTSVMSRASKVSHVSRASAKSGVSMLSRASGTSVMSQLTAGESYSFLHISNDIGSMLGSAIMLTSPSYLDVYHSSYLNLADRLQLPLDEELTALSEGALANIVEEPEDLDSAEAADYSSAPLQMSGAEKKGNGDQTTRLCYSRVVAMAFTFFFVYSAFFSLRNVQSSLSSDPSIGLLALGSLYTLPWLGAVCSYPIVHRIRPKWTMVCATVPFLLFAASNYHATAYTVLPASLVQGFGLGLIWAAEGLYMVNIASTYAIVFEVPLNEAIGKFNSIFYAVYQSSNVVGNAISSLILQSVFPGEDSIRSVNTADNDTDVGAAFLVNNVTAKAARVCGVLFDYATKMEQTSIVPAKKYTLVSVMTFMAMAGLLVAVFLMQRLDIAHLTGAKNVFVSFHNMLKMIIDPRMLLLFPVFVYFGFSGSLMFGDYAKAFINCQYGASKIGLVFLVGASVGVLGSFTSGVVAKYTGRAPVILVAGLVASGAYITMLFWTPPEGNISFLLFLPVMMWCFSDGILSSQINGFQGFLFQEKLPSACAAYLLCYGLSVGVGTMTAAFQWITLTTKTYLIICMQVAALTSYIFIEGLLRRGVLQQG